MKTGVPERMDIKMETNVDLINLFDYSSGHFLRVVIKGHPGRMREYVEGLYVKGENMENTKRIYGVDLLKFFMAFAVISIHTSLASMINGEIAYSCLIIIQKAAVPFFFICNGYFAGVSKRNNYKAYAFRFAKMYVIWSIIYLPLDLIGGVLPLKLL